MKKNFSTILLVLIFFVGLSVLLYPTVSDYWNSVHQSRAIASYVAAVDDMSDAEYNRILEDACAYNQRLYESGHSLTLTDTELADYESQLDIQGTGVMSYIVIDKIGCELPIYHGTDEAVLQVAIGHLEGTSLPVGGANTHCVLSGHRGLPSAQLFSRLDELEVGDTFILRTIDEVLTYEVDKISIVLPEEVDELAIVDGEDYCTLVTCTPYGVNSHRLLVRGRRTANEQRTTIRVAAEATQIEPVYMAPLFAAPLLLLMFIWLLVHTRKKKRGVKNHEG